MKNPLKIGLDIHGVIDTFPRRFKLLSSALVKDDAEVHIVTGVKRDDRIEKLLLDAGIHFTHYFSIVEHLEANHVAIEWRNGEPFADETKWNSAKRDYCKAQGIDLMFDDSAVYRDTFHDIDTTFLHVINA
ncbi:MAG TPA: hypothetical protein ENJ08_14725 [Gammaproteobacteria bacterium]|nr:hypothetical protein [Gammaproteobacteria bacterium]